MYNEEWKRTYMEIASVDHIIQYKNFFNKSESFEKEKDKDLCEFTKYEIMDMYKSFNTSSFYFIYDCHSLYKRYTDYCLSKGVIGDGQNHYYEVSIDTILKECINKRFLNKKIITREDVEFLCSSFPNPREAFSTLAIFEYGGGKQYKDIWSVKLDQFDGKGKLTLDRGQVEVDSLLLHYAEDANSELTYYTPKSFRPLEDSIYIYKFSTKSKSEVPRDKYWSFNRAMQTSLKLLDANYITIGGIETSGIIDFIKRKSKEKNISSEEYLNTYVEEINYQFGKSIRPALFMKQIGGLL